MTNLGTLRFMIYEGALNAFIFLSFLRRLIKSARRKVFLIVDNLRVHQAKRVTAWLEANRDRIEVFYLPPYASDHNPDEFMHKDLKQGLARRRIPKVPGHAEIRPAILYAQPAKAATQSPVLLPGTHRPLRRMMPWQCFDRPVGKVASEAGGRAAV